MATVRLFLRPSFIPLPPPLLVGEVEGPTLFFCCCYISSVCFSSVSVLPASPLAVSPGDSLVTLACLC